MNPILYAKDETNFNTMGIGVLSDTLSCHVTQDAGCYELEMEYPIGGIHFSSIQHSCWLKVICPPRMEYSPQLFYIVHISKPLNKRVTILAHHISYKLNFIPIKPFQSAHTVSDLLNVLKSNATEAMPFTFETDKGAYPVNMTAPYPVMAMSLLGGSEGSLLDLAGGEFIWDNYKVTFKDQVGEDFGYELRYGVNVTDLKQEENISDTVTGVVPYWFNEGYEGEPNTLVMLPETTLYSSNASDFPFKRSVTVDFSGELEATYDDNRNMIPPTVAQLRSACQEYIYKAGIGVPKVSIDVSMENLARSHEYEHLKPLQQVKLYDIVTVIFPLLHIQVKAKVIKTVFDVQTQSYISISIGERQSSLSDRFVTPGDVSSIFDDSSAYIKQSENRTNRRIDGEVVRLDNNINSSVTRLETEMDAEIASTKAYADRQLATLDTTLRNKIKADIKASSDAIMGGKGGYVVMHQDTSTDPPHVDEILVMDTNKESTARKIIRLNKNGLGFSSNGGVSYDSTWTIDGTFIANKIDSQTVNALKINTATINAGTIKTVALQAITIDAGTDPYGNVLPSYIRSATIEAGNYMTFNYRNADNTSGRVTVGSGTVTTHLTANNGTTYTGQMFQSSNPGSAAYFTGGTRDSVIIDANAFAVVSKGFAIGAEQGNHAAGITVENIDSSGAVLILQNRNWAGSEYTRITLKDNAVTVHWGPNEHQTASFSSSGFRFGGDTYTRTRVGDLDEDQYVLAD